jgi:hypothetical protein
MVVELRTSEAQRQYKAIISQALDIMSTILPTGQKLGELPPEAIPTILYDRLAKIESDIADLAERITSTIPVYERFIITELTTNIPLAHSIKAGTPVQVVWDSLPQKRGLDFEAADSMLTWLSGDDQLTQGIVEIIYYRDL